LKRNKNERVPNDQNPGDVATIIEETTDRKLTKESRQKKLFSRQVLSVAIFFIDVLS